jgi:hypothetical protein
MSSTEIAIQPSDPLGQAMHQMSQYERDNPVFAYKIVTAISKFVASGGNIITTRNNTNNS